MNTLYQGDNLRNIAILIIAGFTFVILGCGETEWERNYHTHWHKHKKSDWAYHADGHSHFFEEGSGRLHLLRYGKEGYVIEPGHIWFYHGFINEKKKYEQYLIWAENNLKDTHD